ncbi:MAG: flagellar hook-length control protein FliK [Pseudomonadota bacterium]
MDRRALQDVPATPPGVDSAAVSVADTFDGPIEGRRPALSDEPAMKGRGRDAAYHQGVTPTPNAPWGNASPGIAWQPSAPYSVSPGLALGETVTPHAVPEDIQIDAGADVDFPRFDLASRDPLSPQAGGYARLEHVRQPVVMAQVADAARTLREGQMEITLVPEELGRVRLTMTPSEAGMAVTIMAERPETLELMRRNIELLARDLSGQGFENLSFSFGGSGAGAGGSTPEHNMGSSVPAWSTLPALDDGAAPTISQPTSGLDLRL